MRFRVLVWFLCVGVACNALALSTEGPEKGFVFVVVENSAGSTALDLKAGDLIHGWQALPENKKDLATFDGLFQGPFDWLTISLEYGPRWPINLLGEGQGEAKSWPINPEQWAQLSVRPQLPGEMEFVYGNIFAVPENEKGDEWERLWALSKQVDTEIRLWVLREALLSGGEGAWAAPMMEELRSLNEGVSSLTTLDAWVRRTLAEILDKQGDMEGARTKYRTAAELFQEKYPILAAHCYYQAGITAYRQRNLDLTKELLERARVLQEGAAPDSQPYAATLNALGGIANLQGRLDEAQALFEKALAIRERSAPGSLDVAGALNNLGSTAWRRGKLDEAQAYLERSLAIKEKLDPGSLGVAATLNNLGIIARDRSLLSEAEAFHRRSLSIKEKLAPGSEDAASSYINLGVVARDRGDLRLAESRYLQALAIREKLAPDSIDVAQILNNLGNLAQSRANYSAARDFHRRALAIREKVVPDTAQVAESLGNLALSEAQGGNLKGARELHQQALSIHSGINPSSMDVAAVMNNLAILERDGGRFREAEDLLRKSLRLKLALVPGGLEVARTQDMLGLVLQDQGRLDDALVSFRVGLALRSSITPGTLDEAESAYHVGRILVETGKKEEAFDFFQQAVGALENQIDRLGGTQEDQARVRDRASLIYLDFIRLSVDLNRVPWAFHLLERSRVRVMLSMLAERDLDFSRDMTAELLAEKTSLQKEYRKTQEAIALAGTSGQPMDELMGQLADLQAQQKRWQEKLRQASPRLGTLQAPEPLTLPQAQNLLQPGDLLLAWSVGREASLCFTVTKNDIQAITIPVTQEELGIRVRRHVQTLRQGSPSPMDAPLTRLLLGPVAGQISQARRLILMPDGPLHVVPFAALPFGGEEKVLVDHLPLVHIQSMTLLQSLKPTAGSSLPESVLALGDPVYSGEAAGKALRLRGLSLSPLPGTRKEVEAIARTFPAGARTLVGDEATEESIQKYSDADLLHFACHGLLDPVLPLSSGLVLSPPKGDPEEHDGFLQAWEIFENLRLDADLVTLSACETGLGEHMGGEGIIGLSRAFQYAGAENVLVSLWPISDESTADFMQHFYQALAEGQDQAAALRSAQVELKSGEAYGNPFYWAPFILQGPGR